VDDDPELPRVTCQVIRNNIARTLACEIKKGPALTWGVDEYFEMWGDGAFPWVAGGTLTLHRNPALSDEERDALKPLVELLNVAWSEADEMSVDQFLQSEWPSRINALAAGAYSVMAERGCFSEVVAEEEPSGTF
jgi:hypothetical protein